MKVLLTLLSLAVSISIFSQDSAKRELPAVRTTTPPKIDGDISDDVWKLAPVATNMVEWRPSFGLIESDKTKTEVRFLYDDNAIYISGFCWEQRDSISTELAGRDGVGVSDFVGVMFDTYLDEINGVGFYVTSLGEQFDAKYSLGMEDDSWNSVYESKAKIHDNGWSFEMLIPYSAIRFSKVPVQNWGMQITRRRSKSGKQFMWNPVDPTTFGFMNQSGRWTGIRDIRSPLRLSFSPYISSYLNKAAGEKKWAPSINGGMDVKYGISKAFTLDMTLIPDFGQVQSDNLILNLSPFEVRYNENRAFFTEGTELFNKGNFFYSRRIGGTPIRYYNVDGMKNPGDTVLSNPAETKLINATKVSGRTSKGLGVGVFNALTRPEYARAAPMSDLNSDYEIQTNPLTNYSVVVLDQTMKNNSSVTFVNTNVWRSGRDYDANVAGALFDIYDNKVDWNVWGTLANSTLFGYNSNGSNSSGWHYRINGGKFRGRFNFEIHQFMADDKYAQNDLGFFTNNNYIDNGFWAGYKFVKPKLFYNNLNMNLMGTYSQRYTPRAYQNWFIRYNVNGTMKNLWEVGINSDYRAESNDFYEPRMTGKVFRKPESWMAGFWVNTNRTKKYSATAEFYRRRSNDYDFTGYDLYLRNQYRFNDKLTISLSHFISELKNDVGYGFTNPGRDSILFGLRDRMTVENIFNVKYNFNTMMGLTFRARHYWSEVGYKSFFKLEDNGDLTKASSVNRNVDNNANFFNIDMIYTWQFAPGSFINVNWKTFADSFDRTVIDKYYDNLGNILDRSQNQSFSVKVIYYLDYLTLRKKKKVTT